MNKKVIELIAGTLKLDVKELTQVLTSETEVDFKIPENLKVLTSEDLDAIKDNHGKTRYDAGKLAGSEMLLSDMSDKVGFETQIKDMDTFISNYKTDIIKEAGIEPNKKVQELTDSLAKVQGLVDDKDSEILSIKTQYKQKETKLKAQSYFPNLPEALGLSKAEASSIFFNSHEQKEDGIYKNGEKLKDNVEKALTLEQAIGNFVTERKWSVKQPAGNGGGSGSGSGGNSNGKPKTIEEYESYITEKGINPGSVEANALLNDMAIDNN